jgi:hypothetical protein
MLENPDHITVYKIDECENCGYSLNSQKVIKKKKQERKDRPDWAQRLTEARERRIFMFIFIKRRAAGGRLQQTRGTFSRFRGCMRCGQLCGAGHDLYQA